jgi:putative hydrolase
MIWGDFHIHTEYSGFGHATGTTEEIYAEAKKQGLKQVGFSDHGLRHIYFGTNKRKLFKMRDEVDKLNDKNDIKVFMGIESNIYCSDGLIDLQNFDRSIFDYVIAGFHKFVWGKNIIDGITFNFPAIIGMRDKATIRRNTKAYIKAIKTQNIDILSHLNFGMNVDVVEVGKAAADYGVLVELNGKHVSMKDEDILELERMGVKFIINSDAHSPKRVGEVAIPLKVVEGTNLNRESIVNWQKLVAFDKQN